MKKTISNPTDSELAILNVLWRKGPCSVREVLNVISEEKNTGYTTVLKLLQIMTEKGLVLRDESKRSHVYRPAHDEAHTQRNLVQDFMDKVYGGASHKLVMQALSGTKCSKKELDEIKKLINRQSGKK